MSTTAPAASPPMYDVTFVRDVRIPTQDPEVTLGGDLYLPEGLGPVPLIVMVLPYRKDMGGADLLLRYFTRRGYAGLIVDIRGTGSSDGVQRAPFHADEVHDAVAAITWGAEQPWCDGMVGMWGHSYGGMMTMRAAAHRPSALKAIIPVQGMVDPEVDFINPDLALGAFGPASWMAGMLGNLLLPPMHAPDDEAANRRWLNRLDDVEPFLIDTFVHGPGHGDLRSRVVDAGAIDVPALCFVGWRDLFAEGQTRAFDAMTGPKRLIAGPWMHVLPVVSAEGSLDFLGICLAWWDRWLKGVDNGADLEPSVAWVQGPSAYWTALPEWPSDRVVAGSAGAGRADLLLEPTCVPDVSDPSVGALSGLTRLPFAGMGLPLDQHDDDLRSLCWTSPPLADPLTIVGRVEARLEPALQGRVVVKLTHVDPAGRSVMVTSGMQGEGSATAAGAYTIVGLDVTAFEIPAGHRLRVVVSDNDFPRVWPRPASPAPRLDAIALTLPTLTPDAIEEVELPEEPAYLKQLLGAMVGQGPAWRMERELVSGALTMRVEGAAEAGPPGPGPSVASTTSTVASVSAAGDAEVRCSNSWSVHWPSPPATMVRVDMLTTATTLTMTGRIDQDDRVVFERTWSAARSQVDPGM